MSLLDLVDFALLPRGFSLSQKSYMTVTLAEIPAKHPFARKQPIIQRQRAERQSRGQLKYLDYK